MYRNRDTTGDFVIVCNGEKVFCHKIVLASCSPVFKAMMKSDMKEKRNDETNLDIFSLNTVQKLVEFFYKKQIPSSVRVEEILGEATDYAELLHAADYLQVPLLKNICEFSLLNKMTLKSAIQYYKVAKLYNAETLMEKSRKLIIFGKYELMQMEGFIDKLRDLNDMDLMIDILKTCGDCDRSYHDNNGCCFSSIIWYVITKPVYNYLSSNKSDMETT